jgi:hypothetical protein
MTGWWTKIHAKYIFRPLLKKLNEKTLLKLITFNINWMIFLFKFLLKLKMGFLTRFIPITDLRGLPRNLSKDQFREWAILDTFDGFSPVYDNPQYIYKVASMFEKFGTTVTFSGFVFYEGGKSAVVRAIRK